MNAPWLVHLGWMFAGGVWIISLHRFWAWRECEAARRFFDAQHGEEIDPVALIDNSPDFIACVARLEFERRAKKRLTALSALTHAYHPATPFTWLCGRRSDTGTVSMDAEKITCTLCKRLGPLVDHGSEIHGHFCPCSHCAKARLKRLSLNSEDGMDADGYPRPEWDRE